ncbi:hypothetical protein PQQ59_17460 [Paraburkholderia aspalathi]|uniref:hypothetical protein n=1 Tax=Paraburkholderia aspalathi TaxID=1324617 RepID=UPI0038B9AFE6
MTKPTTFAWHYTIVAYFKQIIRSGVLIPSGEHLPPSEKPILWFSLNQYWEATANKAWQNTTTGETRLLDMHETFEIGHGLIRFGVAPKKLLSGDALRRKARMSKAVWDGLAQVGKEQGANPTEWCGSIEAMPIDEMVIEAMDAAFEWKHLRQDQVDQLISHFRTA